MTQGAEGSETDSRRMREMIGFFEQLNRDFVGLHLDPDHAVIGEMLAEKYGLRFRERGDEIELRFLSRPLPEAAAQPAGNTRTGWAVWPGARRTRRYNASVCIKYGCEQHANNVRIRQGEMLKKYHDLTDAPPPVNMIDWSKH